MDIIIKSAASALIAYTAHYGATKFYNYACIPSGIIGYFQGLITTGSPICQVGVQIISNTQVTYSSMIMTSIARVIVDMVAPGLTKGD
jgi:hypothetical protein